jgi:hypothetical protein
VSAARVVKTVDVLKEGLSNLVTGGPGVTPDQFSFQGFEEGLDNSIVITIALAAHRDGEAQFIQALLIIV